jgi:type II secretory pathway component PulJ
MGFTLIEIVIAFTILTMSTVLVVNLVTQSSSRVASLDAHLAAIDTMESAIAVLRGELVQKNIRETYRGQQDEEYHWVARIIDQVNPAESGDRKYLKLYRVRFQVFDDNDQPRLQLVTLIPDR